MDEPNDNPNRVSAENMQSEQAIQAAEQILRTVIDHLPTGVNLIRGTDLRIQLINPAYQAIAPGQTMVGRTLDELWSETGKNFTEICRHVLDTGESYRAIDEINTIRRRPDGPLEKVYFNWSLHRVRLPGTKGWELLNTIYETTGRKRVEEALDDARRKYQDLIETTSEFIWETDTQGRYTYCSPQMETLWGIKPADMIGKTPFDVMPPEDVEKNPKYFSESAQSSNPFRGLESTAFNGKGQLIYIETSGVPFYNQNGEFMGYRGISRDVTERKQAEELLHKTYDDMEQRVLVRTQELVDLNAELISEITDREQAEKKALSSAQLAEGLAQSVIAVNSSLDLDSVLDTILEQVRRSIPCSMAGIMQMDGDIARIIRVAGPENYPEAAQSIDLSYQLDKAPFLTNIINSEQPVYFADITKTIHWKSSPGANWLRSFISAPLIIDGKVGGLILLASDLESAFNQETETLLMKFVAPAALAIQNARRYAVEVHARRVAEMMNAMNLALTQTLDLDTILNTLLEHLPELVSYSSAYITILENEQQLVLRAFHGSDQDNKSQFSVGTRFHVSEVPLIRKVLSSKKSLLIQETRKQPGFKSMVAPVEIRSWLGIPIILRGEPMGVITLVHTDPGQFSEENLQVIESIAAQVSVAIQNAWLFEQVRAGSERLQFLSRRLVEVQENKLLYIAQELHDEVGQALTSLMLGLKILEKETSKSPKTKAAIDEMGQVLENTMENLHRLAIDLRPAVLDQLGLEAALQQLVKSAAKRYNIDMHFEMLGVGERLGSKKEIALYRIVQEALNNIARHAQAKHADVLIRTRGNDLILIIEDDGVGFDPGIATQGDRLGIFGMRERAEMLGGNLTIESSTGKGTTVLVEVPFNHSDILA